MVSIYLCTLPDRIHKYQEHNGYSFFPPRLVYKYICLPTNHIWHWLIPSGHIGTLNTINGNDITTSDFFHTLLFFSLTKRSVQKVKPDTVMILLTNFIIRHVIVEDGVICFLALVSFVFFESLLISWWPLEKWHTFHVWYQNNLKIVKKK